MLARPNHTLVQARVKSTKKADGGEEIELDVTANLSESPDDDFIKPVCGARLVVFSATAAKLRAGDFVEAEATLLAGPFGERVVAKRISRLPKSEAR